MQGETRACMRFLEMQDSQKCMLFYLYYSNLKKKKNTVNP